MAPATANIGFAETVVKNNFIAFFTLSIPLAIACPALKTTTAVPTAVMPPAIAYKVLSLIDLTILLNSFNAPARASTSFGTASSIVHFASGRRIFLYACFSLSPQALSKFLNACPRSATADTSGDKSRLSIHSRRISDISLKKPVISSTMPRIASQIFLPDSFLSQACLILVLRVLV